MISIQAITIDNAWSAVLSAACATRHGRLVHVVLAAERPAPPNEALVTLNDAALKRKQEQEVDTVANTIFPASLYPAPDFAYEKDLDPPRLAELDLAATNLYKAYGEMLPTLTQLHHGNQSGTYFGRLISWPGKVPGGYNQLAVRIRQMRGQRKAGNAIFNAADLVIEGAAEEAAAAGLQVYKSDDERTRAFPCLVHIDLSIHDGRINLMAVYRHWLLITKAYGNLIGLMRLQYFLAQQTGYEVGELLIHATSVDAEVGRYGATATRAIAATATDLTTSTDGAA